ncbi:hypothetical protein ACFP81_07150 [Deinococcus lacus]|uniref:EF-hand domain-containing protein n=1 Tax=Deinococcus lacus TaxID=392561 RepID=A0ABW1YEX5_9DEIO
MTNKRILGLMVALATSAAAAQTVPTAAGTQIRNTATASFDNPAEPGTRLDVPSNTVVTTVLPKPDFDIEFLGNTPADGEGGPANAGVNEASTTSETTDRRPGQTLVTPYQAVNNGNQSLTIALSADTGDSTATPTVAYYPASADTSGDGTLSATEIAAATPIASVTVPMDNAATTNVDEGIVKFFQVLTVPTTAAVTDTVGASPVGSVVGQGLTVNGIVAGQTLYEDQQVDTAGNVVVDPAQDSPADGTDRQFVAANVTTIDNSVPTDPSNPNNPPTTTIIPPPSANPGNPNGGTPVDPVDPNDPTPSPNDPTAPGYTVPP